MQPKSNQIIHVKEEYGTKTKSPERPIVEPITDWNNDTLTEAQWINIAKQSDVFKTNHKSEIAMQHPWDDVFFEGKKLAGNFKYFLGFIATDGSVSKDAISIILSAKDEQILHDFAHWCSDKPRTVRHINHCKKDKVYPMVRLNFAGSAVIRMVRDLLRLDGTDKTCTLRPQTFLLSDPHFLRGVFDGDGNITPAKLCGNSSHTISLTSAATQGFLDPMLVRLKSSLGVTCGYHGSAGNSSVAEVASFYGKAAQIIAEFCYGPAFNDPNLLVLNRKASAAKKIAKTASLRMRPVWMVWNGQRELHGDYQLAAAFLVQHRFPSISDKDRNAEIRKCAQEISACFTKQKKCGKRVYGARFEVPTEAEVADLFGMSLDELHLYNPELVADLKQRQNQRREVNYDLSPIVIRTPETGHEEIYLNCEDATSHPALKKAGCTRGTVQNQKKCFKGAMPGLWKSWTIRKTGETVELRLPTISETLAEIERLELYADEARITSRLTKNGYQP